MTPALRAAAEPVLLGARGVQYRERLCAREEGDEVGAERS
jgi:hypothetical protein